MKISRKIHPKSDFTKNIRNSGFSWRKKQLFWPFSMDVVLVFYGEDCRLCYSLAQDLGAHSFITGNYSSWVLFNLGLSVGVYLVNAATRSRYRHQGRRKILRETRLADETAFVRRSASEIRIQFWRRLVQECSS